MGETITILLVLVLLVLWWCSRDTDAAGVYIGYVSDKEEE